MQAMYRCNDHYSEIKEISIYLEIKIINNYKLFSIFVENDFKKHNFMLHTKINYVKEILY